MAASYIATYGFCVLLKNNSTCEQQLEIVPPSLHLVDDLPQPLTRGLGYNDHTREIIDLLYFHNTSRHVKSLTINVPAHSPGLSVTSLASTGCLKISVRCSFSDAAKACVAVTFLESRLIRGVWGSNFVAFGKSNEACEEQVKESTY